MKTLIIKLLTEQITEDELMKLRHWLKESKNQSILEAYIRDYHDLNLAMIENDVAYIKVLAQLDRKEKPVRKIIPNWMKYAAAVALILLTTIPFLQNENQDILKHTPIKNESIDSEFGQGKVVLTTETGSEIVLEKGKEYEVTNGKSNGETLVYNQNKTTNEEVVYNYATIPRAGLFFIELADGTKVWLNSESKLKYPVSFISGKTREVELIYGEAYFEVSPSENHKGASFHVLTQGQQIEVLGTQFNVKAYLNEDLIATTLVEGKVAVDINEKREYLKPDEQLKYSISTKQLEVSIVNTRNETSWRRGYFSFKNKSLIEISNVLSRWYDVDFYFKNEQQKEERFNGTLSKNQNIETILESIKNTNNIDYILQKKTIIIK